MAFRTKDKLLSFFDQTYVAFTTALAGAVFLVHADCYCLLKSKPLTIMLGPDATTGVGIDLSRSINLLESDPHVPIAPMIRLCFMAAAISLYSATEAYCRSTDQLKLYREQSWYHILRLTRNCLGHDMKWRIGERDKKHLPSTWNGITLTADLNDQDFSFRTVPPEKLMELFAEVERFIRITLE